MFSIKTQLTCPVAQKDRPHIYKEYQDQLVRAYEAVRDGHLSICHAAQEYSVPKSTLADRVSGRVALVCHSGPDRYLSDHEEEELVSFILGCAEMGYAKTKKEALALGERILAEKGGRSITVSNGWWESFKQALNSYTSNS